MGGIGQGVAQNFFNFTRGISAMTVAFAIRLCLRLHVFDYSKQVDISVPASSALLEVLPEITELIGVPPPTQPWRATTAAGRALDLAAPISTTGLSDGSVVILTAEEAPAPPIIRDAAEALADSATSSPARGLVATATICGLSALTAVAAQLVALPLALLVATIATCLLGLRFPHLNALYPFGTLCAVAATSLFVMGTDFNLSRPGLVLLCSLGALIVVTLVASYCGFAGTRALAVHCTGGIFAAVAALCALLPGSEPAFHLRTGAALLLAAIALLHLAPSVVTRVAGLNVPQLPSAGEDLSVADHLDDQVEAHASTAHKLHDGVLLAISICCSLSLLNLGAHAESIGPVGIALIIIFGIAIAIHATRHYRLLQAWYLYAIVLAAVGALALATYSNSAGVYVLTIAGTFALLTATVATWAQFVPVLEPTTRVWIERIEMIALCSCLPLAFHVLGLFTFIRGLG